MDLHRQQVQRALAREAAAVHVVPEEEVLAAAGGAADLEQLHEVVVLPVDVPAVDSLGDLEGGVSRPKPTRHFLF